MWSDLLELKRKRDSGVWCLAVDFNPISSSKERKGVEGGLRRSEMIESRSFIDDMKLFDVP